MNTNTNNNKPNNPLKKKPLSNNKAMLYANMGFQLLAAIIIGVLIGKQIDLYFNNQTPYATAGGALVGIAAGLYNVLKDLI